MLKRQFGLRNLTPYDKKCYKKFSIFGCDTGNMVISETEGYKIPGNSCRYLLQIC